MVPFSICVVMVFLMTCAFDYVTIKRVLWKSNLLFTACVGVVVGVVIFLINFCNV